MAITHEAAGTLVAGTTTPQTVVLPSHVAGDFLLVVMGTREDNPVPVYSITVASGWTSIGLDPSFLDLGTTGIAVGFFWKIAASSAETNPVINCPTPNVLVGFASVFRGVDPTTPLGGIGAFAGSAAAATTLTPTGRTTSAANSWVISGVASADDNALALSVPQTFSLLAGGSSYHSNLGGAISLGLAGALVASPGTPTMPTWNQTVNGADAWAYKSFVLAEGAVVGGRRPATRIGRARGNLINARHY